MVHCFSTGKIGGLAHNQNDRDDKETRRSFVPKLFHNFSGYQCQTDFRKLFSEVFDKIFEV